MSQESQYIILNKKNYFAIADEYIKLKQLFKTDTFYEKLGLFMKLIGSLILSLLWKSSSLSLCFTLYRTIEDWKLYIRYLEMKHDITTWKTLVKNMGGPFISTNDETYYPYIYADGMQRLHNSLFGLTKKRTKCLK